MKAIKIDRSGSVESVEWSFDDTLDDEVIYDAISLGPDHAMYVDDEGLFRDSVTVARVGGNPNVPLPAMIVGVQGESDVDATLTVQEVAAMIGDVRHVR